MVNQLKLGRLKNDPSKPRLRLTADVAPLATYTPPLILDRYSAVPGSLWGMDGNNNVGDCTCADVDHEIKSVQTAAGNPLVRSTATEVLAAYSAITGYNPADPNTDQGAMMQDVRSYWRKTGFTLGGKADKILLFAELKLSDPKLIEWSLEQIGAIGLGINFPDSAMDQFNAGKPWDVVAGEPDPTEGHAIALVGYDESYWYILTWGKVQKMTPAFFTKYVEEAWVAFTADFVNATTGNTPLQTTLYQLGQQFQTITGQTNPIPAPGPAPTPTPAPPALGVTKTFTSAQAAALDAWAAAPHWWSKATAAAKAWKQGVT